MCTAERVDRGDARDGGEDACAQRIVGMERVTFQKLEE